MTNQEMRPDTGARERSMDRKAVFDAGYSSYEDGKDESDFGSVSETTADSANFTAMWRFGWQRAHEDSALSRRRLRFE